MQGKTTEPDGGGPRLDQLKQLRAHMDSRGLADEIEPQQDGVWSKTLFHESLDTTERPRLDTHP